MHKKKPPTSRKTSKIIIAILLVVFLIIVAVLAFAYYAHVDQKQTQTKSDVPYDKVSVNLQDDIDQSKDVTELVEGYASHYEAAMSELSKSDPVKWNQSDVDKAHLCLLYADKIGAFSETLSLTHRLEIAKKAGIDVDNNAVGVSQEKRDEVRQRAEKETVITTGAS